MIMKKQLLTVTIVTIFLCLSSVLAAAQLSFERDSVNEIVNFILTEHRRGMKEFIQLTDDEREVFWPIFEDYQNALRNVIPQFVTFTKALTQVRNEHKTLSARQADTIINDIIDAKIELLVIQKSYMKKFRNVLPAQKVLLFLEVDEGITMAFRLKRLSEMPLVK
jgi:hypothetical protein